MIEHPDTTLPVRLARFGIQNLGTPQSRGVGTFTFLVIVTAACRQLPAPYAARPSFAIPEAAAVDAEARRLMASEDVKGMALAVIDDGRVVLVAAYGQRNVERKLPLQTDTVMYGASLTKTAFAYMILQLAEEGRIGLDTSIAAYLPSNRPGCPGCHRVRGTQVGWLGFQPA